MKRPHSRGYSPAFIIFTFLFSMRAFASWHAAPKYFVPLAQAQAIESAKPIEFAPIGYYDQSCARCHGNYGTNYDANLPKLDDAKLKRLIDEMASGPGQAPLDAAQLERETAYHRSLQDGAPFIAVTKIEESSNGIVISGEATPGSKLSIGGAAQSTLVAPERHLWSTTLPAGTDIETLRLTASKNGKETTIALADESFSHREKK